VRWAAWWVMTVDPGATQTAWTASGLRAHAMRFLAPAAPDSVARRLPRRSAQGPARHQWTRLDSVARAASGLSAYAVVVVLVDVASVAAGAPRRRGRRGGARTTWPGGDDGGRADSGPHRGVDVVAGDNGERVVTTVGGRRANAMWWRQKCKVAASKCEGRKENVPSPNPIYRRARTCLPYAPYIRR
jgi:hypothetical protein